MQIDDATKAQHEKLMKAMKKGESFFVEAKPEDLTYVRKLGYKLGIKLSIRFVVMDEIYGKMGSRVVRL
jgi:predicted kinase